MDRHRKVRVLTFFFGAIIIGLTLWEIYTCAVCLELEDEFDEYVKSELCLFLGKPMALFMVIFEFIELIFIICFIIGVWKGRWSYLISWVSLHTSYIIYLITFSAWTTKRITPIILSIIHLFLWFVGVYIYSAISRFDREISFA